MRKAGKQPFQKRLASGTELLGEGKKQMVKQKMTQILEKNCSTCRKCWLGFTSDTSWDACDMVCHNGDFESKLMCTHGLSPKDIQNKLQKLNKNCLQWKPKERVMVKHA